MEKRVGIIGYGSIGKEIIAATSRNEIPNARIVALFDKESTVFNKVDYDNGELNLFSDFDEFYNSDIYSNIDIIIECASKGAIKEYGKKIIDSKKDLIVLSVGAFSDEKYLIELQNLSNLNNTKILIPSGAIAGLDSIRSVKKYLNTSKIRIDEILKETVLFEGNAVDAIELFPANVNVAVSVALAGIGLVKTQVKIVADPTLSVNKHEIVGEGAFGKIHIVVQNIPSPSNPRTSY